MFQGTPVYRVLTWLLCKTYSFIQKKTQSEIEDQIDMVSTQINTDSKNSSILHCDSKKDL